MSGIRFLTRDEVQRARERIAAHRDSELTRNMGKVVAAYQTGATPEEKRQNIGQALQEIHDSKNSSAEVSADGPVTAGEA